MSLDNKLGTKVKEKLENINLSKMFEPLNPYKSIKELNKKDKERYFEEVRQDVKWLKRFEEAYGTTPEPIIQMHKDNPLVFMKNHIEKKYTDEYCPYKLFSKIFNKSDKLNYMMLRIEIDNLLNIKNT